MNRSNGFGLLLVLVTTGCATNLSTLQTARTLQPGQIRVGAAVGVYIPAGQAANALGHGVTQARKGIEAAQNRENYTVSEADQEAMLTTALALAVLPPSTSWEINGRYGVAENFDVGLRYGLNALRADAKYRLVHLGDRDGEGQGGRKSFDFAVGLGISRYFFSNPVTEVLEKVKLGNFDRWDVEVPLYISADFNPYFGIYFSPKYVYSRTTVELRLLEIAEACNCVEEKIQIPSEVNMHFVGATAGIRAGLPKLSVYAELTGGNTFVNPRIMGKERNLGGVTLYPSIGLAGTFR